MGVVPRLVDKPERWHLELQEILSMNTWMYCVLSWFESRRTCCSLDMGIDKRFATGWVPPWHPVLLHCASKVSRRETQASLCTSLICLVHQPHLPCATTQLPLRCSAWRCQLELGSHLKLILFSSCRNCCRTSACLFSAMYNASPGEPRITRPRIS